MSVTLTALKVVVAIVLLASAPLALRRRWRLFLAIPLTVFQVFLPWSQVAAVPIPLAYWGALMLWPDLIKDSKSVVTWKPTAYVLGIVVLYAVSMLWSPDRKLGLQPIGYFMSFLVVFSAVVTEARRDTRLVKHLLIVTVLLALVQATAVIVFRLMPGLKLGFYLSPVAKFFISGNSINQMLTNGTNNVLSLNKSGGMLGVNANVSATFLGVTAFIAFGLGLELRRRWLGAVGLVLLGAVPFVGSKAGLILAIAIPLLALQLTSLRYRTWRNRLRMTMAAVVFLGAVAWLGPKAIEGTQGQGYLALNTFFSRSDVTLSSREKIWAFAPQEFLKHPFRGQGFGGWQQDFPHYARKVGLPLDMPPHNTIIYLWSQGGLLAALLGFAFIYQVLKLGWRQIQDQYSPGFGLSLAMTCAFLWTFLQGMGENFGLLGDVHISALLACLLALVYVQRRGVLSPSTTVSPAIPPSNAGSRLTIQNGTVSHGFVDTSGV